MQENFLLAQAKKGNAQAMEKLISAYYDSIFAYCCRRLSDRQTAQDITQETFCHMLASLDSYRHCGKMQNFLYRIAGNLCRDYLKKKKPVYMEELPEPAERDSFTGQAENSLLVRQALDGLTEELREAVLLRFYQDLRFEDIAQIQGSSVSTAKYRVKKALALLKAQMEA